TLNSNNNFHDILREIFKVIIPDGKGIELNASGYAYGLGGPMPTKDILQLYKDHGGEILTIGSDAHEGRHVGHNFSKIIDLIDSLRLKNISTINNIKTSLHPLNRFKR